jgi:hypothetical protein
MALGCNNGDGDGECEILADFEKFVAAATQARIFNR